MSDGCSALCPRCLKTGKLNKLLSVNTDCGRIQNLCPSSQCLFPFCCYTSTGCSVFRDNAEQNSDDSQSLDAFLTEVLGIAPSVNGHNESLDSPRDCALSGLHAFSAVSTLSHTTLDRHKLRASRSEYTSGSWSHDLCFGSSMSTNCLLPRYLADNFKRVANSFKASQLRLLKQPSYAKFSKKTTVKSGDSGVSISSVASLPYSDSYEEHLKHRAHLNPVESRFHTKPQSDVTGSTGYRKCTSLVPLVDRMINNRKERLA